MARIAVIDALFNWPPDGGARTDIKEITSRLSRHHDVRMFIPDFRWLLPRGRIEGAMEFEVERIPFHLTSFNSCHIPRKIKEKVKAFNPDYVLIGDAWSLKPYLIEALSEYPTYIREYAYESTCSRIHAFCGRNLCSKTRLHVSDYRSCLSCTMSWLLGGRRLGVLHEYLISFGYTKNYIRKTISALKLVKGIIVYNDLSKSRFAEVNDRVHIVPGGIDAHIFRPMPLCETRSSDAVLMVGRVQDSTKGFQTLYEACCSMWKEGARFDLLCTAGKQTHYRDVKNVGWLSQEELPQLYARSDICVVPSIWPEAFGIVALEAMACGKPVIVSRVGGLKDIINDGVEGFVVEPRSPEQLKDRLYVLLNSPDLRKRMGEAGRRKVLEKYTWDIIYDKHYSPLFV
jgi:glycosyltransferase involved in cell wall biosynthesis